MTKIEINQTNPLKQIAEKTIDSSGWGLLLIWIGLALMLDLGWGVGLLGVGAILLGAQATRAYAGHKLDWFGIGIGVCFAVAGVSQLYGLQLDESPISVWLVPGLLILAGLAALASAWQQRSGM